MDADPRTRRPRTYEIAGLWRGAPATAGPCAQVATPKCNVGRAAWRQVRRVRQDELVDPERAAILVEEYLAGATMREVAAHHGVSAKPVQRANAAARGGYPHG